MEEYKEYKVEDLVEDPGFREWIYHGTGDREWNEWLNSHPERRNDADMARNILLSIRGELGNLPGYEIKARVRTILSSLKEKENRRPEDFRKVIWYQKYRWLPMAAVVVLGLGLGWLYFSGEKEAALTPPMVSEYVAEPASDAYVIVDNYTGRQKLVNLPDGSSVLLMNKSGIRFPRQFDVEKREVSLKGEAFFEVQKDPDHPFFVYAGEMVTRVLGTSFSIRAYESDAEVRVRVKTGTVSVSALKAPAASSSASRSGRDELVLVSNQQAVLSRSDLKLALLPAGKEEVLVIPIETQNFEFRRTAVPEVFETIEAAYQVEIWYDPDRLKHCTITASLGDEPLREKLNMICEVIGATFTVDDGIIRIDAEGCR